jgi:hypothetical protein
MYDWVASGNMVGRPFDDRGSLLDMDLFARLRHLQAVVDGWDVWSEEAGLVVHVPGDECRKGP